MTEEQNNKNAKKNKSDNSGYKKDYKPKKNVGKSFRVNHLGLNVRHFSKVLGLNRAPFPIVLGDTLVVDTNRGTEIAKVVMKKPVPGAKSNDIKLIKIHRHAKRSDIEKYNGLEEVERDAHEWCKQKAKSLGLPIRISRVEFIFDMKKAIVFFRNAEDGNLKYNISELQASFSGKFNVKGDFKNMGARGEAKILNGCGSCGKPLCCSTFLNKSNPVTVKMAKEQGLPINIPKLSGCCGRLMCCLRYERDNYQRGKLVLDAQDNEDK